MNELMSAVRIIKFDAGHRVCQHESKCRNLHGHEYHAHIYVRSRNLDSVGRIVDFSVVKEKIGDWIDQFWDHNMILWKNDPDLNVLSKCERVKEVFVMDHNPTAENMARLLLRVSNQILANDMIQVWKIKLYETSNCYVEVETLMNEKS